MIAKNKTHLKIFLIILIIFFSCPITKISAGQITVGAMPMGTVVSFGGIRWIKIDSENTFMAVENFSIPSAPIYMQDMTADYCNYMDNFDTLYLSDQRDNKKYAVRKFPDGNCWMIDNLAYGGSTTDGCAGKSTFDGGYTSSTAGYSVYGTWSGVAGASSENFYGDCRDPAVAPYCTKDAMCADPTYCSTHNCGYYYSWQAAIQNSLAYYGNSYQPAQPTTGLCPAGWQLPTGVGDNSALALHLAMGYTVDSNNYCTTGCIGFWQSPYLWNGILSGRAPYYTNTIGWWSAYWSSLEYSSVSSVWSCVRFDGLWPDGPSEGKFMGVSIRCLFSP